MLNVLTARVLSSIVFPNFRVKTNWHFNAPASPMLNWLESTKIFFSVIRSPLSVFQFLDVLKKNSRSTPHHRLAVRTIAQEARHVKIALFAPHEAIVLAEMQALIQVRCPASALTTRLVTNRASVTNLPRHHQWLARLSSITQANNPQRLFILRKRPCFFFLTLFHDNSHPLSFERLEHPVLKNALRVRYFLIQTLVV